MPIRKIVESVIDVVRNVNQSIINHHFCDSILKIIDDNIKNNNRKIIKIFE